MAAYKDMLKGSKAPPALAKAHRTLGRLAKRFDDWSPPTTRQISVGLIEAFGLRPSKVGPTGWQIALKVDLFITPGAQASLTAYESGGKVIIRDNKSGYGSRLNDDAPVVYKEDEMDPHDSLAEAIIEKLCGELLEARVGQMAAVASTERAIDDLRLCPRQRPQAKV